MTIDLLRPLQYWQDVAKATLRDKPYSIQMAVAQKSFERSEACETDCSILTSLRLVTGEQESNYE